MPNNLHQFYLKNLQETKQKMRLSVTEDTLLIQAIAAIGQVEGIVDTLVKRLREWYAWYFPELGHLIKEPKEFATLALAKSKSELISELKLKESDLMGADLASDDVDAILLLAHEVNDLFVLKEQYGQYLERKMKTFCPNLLTLLGAPLAGKLLEHAGSLKRLATLPSSTVQLLGAEKALFRHLTTGARPPRHGVIVNHPLITKAPNALHGKMARALADRISLCARLDYFKGELRAPQLLKELEERLAAELVKLK